MSSTNDLKIKCLNADELKNINRDIKSSPELNYALFDKDALKFYLSIGKPEGDNNLKYQWQIFDFQGTKEDFEILWKRFLKERKCHSCICRLELNFLEDFDFQKIDNFYSYYPFSVVYRIVDLTDGKFYVGMCEVEESWNDGYTGSGGRWLNHCQVHEDHKYERIILKEGFKIPKDTRDFEFQEIKKVFNDKNNCNAHLRTQSQNYCNSICPECNCGYGRHKKGCSKAESKKCPECGGLYGHFKNCSYYKEVPPCPECGGKHNKHLRTCSKYKPSKHCEECNGTYGHKKFCSKYKRKQPKPCPECGRKHGPHKKSCSKYKTWICEECGCEHNHYKWCSKFNKSKKCLECGGLHGNHFKTCSKYKHPKTCPECGGIFNHKKFCSKYKKKSIIKVCSECGGKGGKHKKGCSLYQEKILKPCPKCGKTNGYHVKDCPNYKPRKKKER